MLSRVADNLYWMSRYLERAEHTSRLLAAKEKERAQEAKAREEAAKPAPPPKPPGFFARLLEKAQKPLK